MALWGFLVSGKCDLLTGFSGIKLHPYLLVTRSIIIKFSEFVDAIAITPILYRTSAAYDGTNKFRSDSM